MSTNERYLHGRLPESARNQVPAKYRNAYRDTLNALEHWNDMTSGAATRATETVSEYLEDANTIMLERYGITIGLEVNHGTAIIARYAYYLDVPVETCIDLIAQRLELKG